MLFVSLTFLFLFLPLVLILYYLLKGHRDAQNIVLFLASIFFYAWGEPKFVVVLLASILFNWLLAILIDNNKNDRAKKAILLSAVVINIGLLFIYKYMNFFVAQVNRIHGVHVVIKEIALPIGISFFTFQALSYVIDVYRGENCQRNPVHVGLYISFFPQLIAGPIVRYNAIESQISNRKESFAGIKNGTMRFVQGFTKKILLANTMAGIADKAFSLAGNDLTVTFAWLGSIAYTLQIFFDFSGYSDMAIGLGKLFGFEFDENFNRPYISGSVTEFWRRWHISLSTWFRDYVYIPLGGSRSASRARNFFNLFVVWLLTGIWHGANWTFILWGLLYFMFQMLEKATPYGRFIKKHKVAGHVYTLFVVNLLWVIFRAEGIPQASYYIRTMFGLSGAGFYSGQTWIYIKENLVYLIFAVLLSSNLPIILGTQIRKKGRNILLAANVAGEACMAVLFAISVVYIINGTYNPFIYFHF